ncbi:hypothetical protein [Herminiimonas arsenitoxidans]|uniref:hypothetical protein n=1 Tax=Herminiimonas arsenitoxidans TaxID=1809410 RepID=UPI000970820A|nr:hypothetical protein [Herminiimonas arsenitoxidans]
MTPQQIVALGIRIFALFAAFHSIPYLIRTPTDISNTGFDSSVYLSYGFGVFLLIIAILFWFFPMTLAHRIVPITKAENRLNVQAFDLVRAGGVLIGLWIFSIALPGALWFLSIGIATATENQSYIAALPVEGKIKLAYYAVNLGLSLILIFKSHLFASIVIRDSQIPKDNI